MSDDIKQLEERLGELLAGDKETVEKVDLLNELASAYAQANESRLSLDAGERAREVAETLGYKKGRGQALGNLAFAHFLLSDHEKAVRSSHDAIAVFDALGDQKGLASSLGVLASVQQSLGDYDEAFSTAFKALELHREIGDQMREAWVLTGLGGGHHEVGDYDRAIDNHERSLKIFEELDNKVGVARALNGLGTVYQSKGNYERAREYHHKSMFLFKEMDNKLGEARVLNDLGLIHQKLGDFEKALECHEKSLALRKEVGNRQAQSTSLINLGNLHIEQKDTEKALDVLHRALTIAMEIRARPRIYQANLALSEAHALQGDFSDALDHYKIYQQVKEEVAGEQASSRLKNLQIGFEVDSTRKEAEISRLKNVELKQKNEQLEELLRELKEMQTQLVQTEKMAALGSLIAGVVHEINNPLGAINSATDVSRRVTRMIADALDSSASLEDLKDNKKFQNALRTLDSDADVTLEATRRVSRIVQDLKSFVRLDEAAIQEVDLRDGLASTLNLMEHDFGNRIRVVRDFGSIPVVRCNPGEMNQVFMNLLTNARQAIDDNGTITVRTFEEAPNVCIEISDTGVGIPEVHMGRLFDPTITKKGARVKAGLGLFTSYNIVKKHDGNIAVESEVGKGTTFTLTLPAASSKG
jgi:signal transduction histidine kinase